VKVLIALTYYRPHYSGLTIYAERLARALAERGHQVTVLTARYDGRLPTRELRDGVQVIRLNVRLRVSKGVIAPSILYRAWKLSGEADIVHLHLPQLDAAYLALVGRLLGKPVVLTYHCDLRLPPGFIHSLANQVSHIANHISARAASAIVTNTRDYAENSAFLRRYLPKVQPILPPAGVTAITEADREAFRRKANIQPGQRIIGMAARLATEKGVEFLTQAMPLVMQHYPTARVLFMGQYQQVFGEQAYAGRLAPLIQALGEHWTFLGNLPPDELAAFFHECEVTVLPSLNSTESFGMVQIESMLCGTPVVASDLPGVRQPVSMTGMGRTVPVADAPALAQAIMEILDRPQDYGGDTAEITRRFAPQTIAQEYEALFDGLRRHQTIEDISKSAPSNSLSATPNLQFATPNLESAIPAWQSTIPNQQSAISNRPSKDFLWLHLRDLPYFRAMLRAAEAQFYQDFELPSPVLDVGCGDGHFASLAFDQPLDVGLDPWGGPVRQAARLGGYRALVQADGGVMPLPAGYFASALSNSVLEHIPHVQQVLAEVARVLQPGAPFLFCVPNPRYLSELSISSWLARMGLSRLAEGYREWFRRMSRVQHAQPPQVWQGWLEQAGFRLEKWWHYFSPQALRILEWGHYFGAPTLLPHAVLGRWIIAPYRWNLGLTARLVRRHTQAIPDDQGTFTFYVARKI